MAIISIAFIVISTVVLTLNTLPYFQVSKIPAFLSAKDLLNYTSDLFQNIFRKLCIDGHLFSIFAPKLVENTFHPFIIPVVVPAFYNVSFKCPEYTYMHISIENWSFIWNSSRLIWPRLVDQCKRRTTKLS